MIIVIKIKIFISKYLKRPNKLKLRYHFKYIISKINFTESFFYILNMTN